MRLKRLGDGMPEPIYDPSTGVMLPAGGPNQPEPAGASQSDVRAVDNAIIARERSSSHAKGVGLLIGAFLIPLFLRRKRR